MTRTSSAREVTEGADKPKYSEGDIVTYSVTVTNTSKVTLDEVVVTAPIGSTFVLPEKTEPVMAPGASLTFTAKYTITAADVAREMVKHEITAVGKAPNGTSASKPVAESWYPAKVSAS